VVLALSHEASPVEQLTEALRNEHEVLPQVSSQIMSWFGDVTGGYWKMDVNAVVKEVGLGILRNYKVLSFLPSALLILNEDP
jgi:sister chromatid cohesion protein DCC1